MNHRFSPRALARFGRKKVRLGGRPAPWPGWPVSWGTGPGPGGPNAAPYPAAVDGHYLSFCAGEAIRFEHLFSPLREELARVEGEIQRLQAAPQSPAPDSLAEAARSHREAAARQSQLGTLAVQRAQLTELLTQAETILAERPSGPGASPRPGKPPTAPGPAAGSAALSPWWKGPCPSSGSPPTGERTLRKECCEHVRKEAKGPAHRRRPDGHPGGSPL